MRHRVLIRPEATTTLTTIESPTILAPGEYPQGHAPLPSWNEGRQSKASWILFVEWPRLAVLNSSNLRSGSRSSITTGPCGVSSRSIFSLHSFSTLQLRNSGEATPLLQADAVNLTAW